MPPTQRRTGKMRRSGLAIIRHIRNERAKTKNPIHELNKQVVVFGLEVLTELEV
jgi:hypothetical protein